MEQHANVAVADSIGVPDFKCLGTGLVLTVVLHFLGAFGAFAALVGLGFFFVAGILVGFFLCLLIGLLLDPFFTSFVVGMYNGALKTNSPSHKLTLSDLLSNKYCTIPVVLFVDHFNIIVIYVVILCVVVL